MQVRQGDGSVSDDGFSIAHLENQKILGGSMETSQELSRGMPTKVIEGYTLASFGEKRDGQSGLQCPPFFWLTNL